MIRPAESTACTCGYQPPPSARYCRRCGAELPATSPALRHEAVPPAPTPLAVAEFTLHRPVGATARLLRDRARESRAASRPPPAPRRIPPLDEEYSARQTLTRRQVSVLRFALFGALIAAAINVQAAATGLVAAATLLYLGALVFRVRTFVRALTSPPVITISDEEALGLWDRSLPNYTVLVPAYREPEIIKDLIAELGKLDYPVDRLDIKLLLEEDDIATINAAEEVVSGAPFEIVRIPYSEPRTKPKALNYGLRLARGAPGRGMVTIYDAEDRPDPLQLRRAVVAMRRADPSVACLQAKLAYHNVDQNILTRWFTVEYAMWFSQLLPGLVAQQAPLPLGGTSNHFRRAVLEQLGGWDPYNVTEDADLGIRLHRMGYRTGVLDSTTYEEANSDFVNWIKQRSRWYKGYLQTWLVHMRHPLQLLRELGPAGFIGFNLFVGGTPLLSLLNPIFWVMTVVWFVIHPAWVAALFPAWLYYLSLLCLTVGNFAFVYTTMVAARITGSPRLVLASALAPAYWVMMSIAAIKAILQLVNAPSFWEKTFHGLDRPQEAEVRERAAA